MRTATNYNIEVGIIFMNKRLNGVEWDETSLYMLF
jgi:hypothetical protein